MKSIAQGLGVWGLVLAATASGCTSFGHFGHIRNDDCEPRRYSDEWWAREAEKPVGTRQIEKKGKLWPPYPRPVGEPQQCCHEYHAAHYWPWPYVCDDRAYVKALTQSQINNGWTAETTLYEYHFDEEKHLLTDSGERQLQWILENAPQEHRMIWVQTAIDAPVSQQRLDAVRKSAVRMVGEGNVPSISLRVTSPLGRPALEVDAIRRAEIGSIPEPRIPVELEAASGGSSQ